MIPGKAYTPEDFLRLAWRRKWILVLPLLVASAAAVLVAQRLPNRYRSETLILVVPQRVPESYVKSTVTERIEDRLRSISQQILSRTRLERVIQDFDLYRSERKAVAMEDVVEKMRKDIAVDTVKGDAFTVSYTSGDARTAMKVTERLASMFIEENLRDREVMAEGTDQFLESQLDDARHNLIEDEKKLEEYRKKYSGELPSQLQSNLQVIQTTETQLQALVDSINHDRDQKLLLQRLIDDAQPPLQSNATEPAATKPRLEDETTAADGAASEASGRARSASEQLELARSTLRSLELRLKPEHPDVVRLKSAIRDLEAKAAAEPHNRPAPAKPVVPDDTARQKRVHDNQLEIDALDRRIAEKEEYERKLQQSIAGYQRRVEAVPSRESELAELTRDYDTLQKTYAGLLAKKEDSKIAANLERRQIGEQFKILDPARVPEKPVSPNRPLIEGAGAAAGLIIGVGIVALLEYLDTTLKVEDDIVQALTLPVLALIPVMTTAADRKAQRRRRLLVSCATAAVMAVGAAAVAAWKFEPLLKEHVARWIR